MLLYGRAVRLTAENGGSRPGQLPNKLPLPPAAGTEVRARAVKWGYYMNVCTMGCALYEGAAGIPSHPSLSVQGIPTDTSRRRARMAAPPSSRYSLVFTDWAYWEKQIDWMALLDEGSRAILP